MGKAAYIGRSSLAYKIGKLYIGIGGVARKVTKGYIGVGGLARQFYSSEPVLIYERSTVGTESVSLAAGTYELTLIGGGGGASGRRCTTNNNYFYAQGGVGGTLQVIAKLTSAATISISLGAGGVTNTGTFSSASGGTVTGTAGSATSITGFTNLTISAGGGTGGSTRATSTTACSRTVGVMGTNSVSGSALQSTVMNNPNTITSNQGTGSSSAARTGTGRMNDNWPDDTTRGRSGDCGWSGTSFRTLGGLPGYIRIRKL